MKQLLVVLAFSFCLTASAQKGKTNHPPASVNSAFTKAHPGVTGTWKKEGKNYEVDFTDGGNKTSCVIDAKGTIIETETEIRPEDLPQAARTYLEQHHKGQKIKDAARIQKANGTVQYEAGIGKKDVLFDEKGMFVKEAKD